MIVVTGSTHQGTGPIERQAVWAACQFLHRTRMTFSADKGPVGDTLRIGDREDSVKPVTVRAHSVRTTVIPVDTCLEVLLGTRVAVAAHRGDPSAWNPIGFFPMTSFAIYDRVCARLNLASTSGGRGSRPETPAGSAMIRNTDKRIGRFIPRPPRNRQQRAESLLNRNGRFDRKGCSSFQRARPIPQARV